MRKKVIFIAVRCGHEKTDPEMLEGADKSQK